MTIINEIKDKIKDKHLSLVYPEGTDLRILRAACRLRDEKVLTPILLGDPNEIEETAAQNNLTLDQIIIIDPKTYYEIEGLVEVFVERRKGKVDREAAYKLLEQPNYFGTLMVETGRVNGMVSGAVYTTADTVRPALQIIKTMPGISKTSGLFILLKGDDRLLMADCAINPDLTAEDLAEVAILTDRTGRQFGLDPKIAMLSYSTRGSAHSEEVDKVQNAVLIARDLNPDIRLDGEFQFDAAIDPGVASRKVPDSEIAGHANAFIFPDLSSGNIGYKIAQRLGNYEAIGPILQGLNKPVNDLSRGCNEEDVYALSILTGAQAIL